MVKSSAWYSVIFHGVLSILKKILVSEVVERNA